MTDCLQAGYSVTRQSLYRFSIYSELLFFPACSPGLVFSWAQQGWLWGFVRPLKGSVLCSYPPCISFLLFSTPLSLSSFSPLLLACFHFQGCLSVTFSIHLSIYPSISSVLELCHLLSPFFLFHGKTLHLISCFFFPSVSELLLLWALIFS